MSTTYILVPGYTNAGPKHWMSYIEKKYSNCIRVEQDNWEAPSSDWVEKLNQFIEETSNDIILLGHSCGSVAIAQWASSYSSSKVKAIILVAPADIEQSDIPAIRAQGKLPTQNLGIKSLMIYSDNDEHLSTQRATYLAKMWGCETHLLHNAGHIHTAAGYGDWPDGEKLFEKFTKVLFIKRNIGR